MCFFDLAVGKRVWHCLRAIFHFNTFDFSNDNKMLNMMWAVW